MRKDKGSGLNEKQQLFADEYLKDFNGKQAAIRAGYAEASAEVTASRLLSNAKVQAYIAKRIDDRNRRVEISQDRVLLEVARIAFRDIRDFYDESGALTAVHALSDDAAACVDSIEVFEETDNEGVVVGYTKKLRLTDKMAALNLLMRHMGLDKQKVELTGKNGGPVEVKTKVVVVPSKVPAVVETKPMPKSQG